MNKKQYEYAFMEFDHIVDMFGAEAAKDWLVNVLHTHNPDGTLAKEFGGWYTKPNPGITAKEWYQKWQK